MLLRLRALYSNRNSTAWTSLYTNRTQSLEVLGISTTSSLWPSWVVGTLWKPQPSGYFYLYNALTGFVWPSSKLATNTEMLIHKSCLGAFELWLCAILLMVIDSHFWPMSFKIPTYPTVASWLLKISTYCNLISCIVVLLSVANGVEKSIICSLKSWEPLYSIWPF